VWWGEVEDLKQHLERREMERGKEIRKRVAEIG
jgi:hypothetical protein